MRYIYSLIILLLFTLQSVMSAQQERVLEYGNARVGGRLRVPVLNLDPASSLPNINSVSRGDIVYSASTEYLYIYDGTEYLKLKIALGDLFDVTDVPAIDNYVLTYVASENIFKPSPPVTYTVGSYTDEQAQDAVGGIFQDTSTIDFTYNDGTPSIVATFINAAGYLTAESDPQVALVTANYVAKGDGTSLTTNNSFLIDNGNGSVTIVPSGSVSTLKSNSANARMDYISARSTGANVVHQFVTGTAATALTINETGDLGVGTNAQKNKLDVEGAAVIGSGYSGTSTAPSNGLLVQGNVGIGNTSPGGLLQIGTVASPYRGAFIFNTNSTSGYTLSATITDHGVDIGTNSSARSINLQPIAGKVGINTTIPVHPLQVTGNVFSSDHYIGAVTMGIIDDATNGIINALGVSGIGTTSLIDITHQPSTNDIDFAVENDLSLYDNGTSGFLTSESDPQVGSTATNFVAKGNGTEITTDGSSLTDTGSLVSSSSSVRVTGDTYSSGYMIAGTAVLATAINIGNSTGTTSLTIETGNSPVGFNPVNNVSIHRASPAVSVLSNTIADAFRIYNDNAVNAYSGQPRQRTFGISFNGEIYQAATESPSYTNYFSALRPSYLNSGQGFSIQKGTFIQPPAGTAFQVQVDSSSNALIINNASVNIGLPVHIHSPSDGTEDNAGKLHLGSIVWTPKTAATIGEVTAEMEPNEEVLWTPEGGPIVYHIIENENANNYYITQLEEYTDELEGTFYPKAWNIGGKAWVARARQLQ